MVMMKSMANMQQNISQIWGNTPRSYHLNSRALDYAHNMEENT